MLHILRHSPGSETRFASCLRGLGPQQSLLLLEDAVYGLLPRSRTLASLQILPGSVRLYAIEADVLARGIALDDLPERLKLIDYPAMVQLCVYHSKVVSW
ncbi:sulfurtransferase complex subunit TusB [Pseudomonas sp. gcc21]|uniref:sulfurtransferase complex subunit TusB n=1 Tax=Pseudomonas sp. gcc21 TaxID=2726989 RepID=UPI001451B771|nr:sulfurtransferase complex subunit TusB [Pseudomonas sp. gcc21]QJD58416.1 sulfurtransferase complex subunit TusB [Pseudomonas sp. gcc21]